MTLAPQHDANAALMPVNDFVAKLRTIRDSLTDGLVERDIPVQLGLLTALAGEHLLMVGPPGTAKSLIARRLQLAFADSAYFERLLTRFTVPEELFGPLSIKGLEEDRYERLTEAYLPTASIAFLDEIFKANSAILNSLLTLLNEREFDNGAKRHKTPLIAVIGASNELPEGDELEALFDRFLLRLHVGPVTAEAFPKLLALRGQSTPVIPDTLKLHNHEITAIQLAADAVVLPEDVLALLCDLRDWCTAEGLSVSDRRWRKIVKLLQVSAVTNARTSVSVWDCWLLQHCLWDTPEAREKVFNWYSDRVGASAAMDPSRLTTIVVSWEAKLNGDKESRSQMRDAKGKPLFKNINGKHTVETVGMGQARRGTEPLFLAPVNAYQRNGYSTLEIDDRSNDGDGFTREELDDLSISDGRRGSSEFQHWDGRDAYLADESNWHLEDVDLIPALEPTRQKEFYIDGCVNEMEGLKFRIDEYQNNLVNHIKSLENEIRNHLWVSPEFAEPAARSLEETRSAVQSLLLRVAKLRDGFAKLPRETDEPIKSQRKQGK